MNLALKGAEASQGGSQRGLFGSGGTDFVSLISEVPGMGGGLASTARDLQSASAAQQYENDSVRASVTTEFTGPPGSGTGPMAGVPGMSPNFDPVKVAKQIYPILGMIYSPVFGMLH